MTWVGGTLLLGSPVLFDLREELRMAERAHRL